MNKDEKIQVSLVVIGFALLLQGMVLANVLDSNLIVKIIGIAFLAVAIVLLGAAVGAKTTRKK